MNSINCPMFINGICGYVRECPYFQGIRAEVFWGELALYLQLAFR